jgi:hypothetical protein
MMGEIRSNISSKVGLSTQNILLNTASGNRSISARAYPLFLWWLLPVKEYKLQINEGKKGTCSCRKKQQEKEFHLAQKNEQ